MCVYVQYSEQIEKKDNSLKKKFYRCTRACCLIVEPSGAKILLTMKIIENCQRQNDKRPNGLGGFLYYRMYI